jgi:hypothetical protein
MRDRAFAQEEGDGPPVGAGQGVKLAQARFPLAGLKLRERGLPNAGSFLDLRPGQPGALARILQSLRYSHGALLGRWFGVSEYSTPFIGIAKRFLSIF